MGSDTRDKNMIIQGFRNRGVSKEVLELISDDADYGLTREQIARYADKNMDFAHMKICSKCLRNNYDDEVIKVIVADGLSISQMEMALEFYEKGVPIEAVKKITQSGEKAVTMKKLYEDSLAEGNKFEHDREPEYVTKIIKYLERMNVNLSNADKRFTEVEDVLRTLLDNNEGQQDFDRILKENQEKDVLLSEKQDEINKAYSQATENSREREVLRKENKKLREKISELEEKYSKKKKSDTEVIEFSKKESSEVDNLNRHIRIDSNSIERKTPVNSRGAISIFTKLAIKTKSRRNLVKLVIEGELDKNQLIQIKSAIEKGLTESQLEEIINGRISAERMKEIIEIAMKVGSDGIEAMKKVLAVLKGMLDYEKNLGRTSMRKLLMRGGDLQVLEFSNSEMRKVKRLAKKYGILYSMMPNINKGQTEIIFHSEATPRINVMLQKLKSGQISTFDDYVKKSDNDGKNKLIDYFQKQKDGNERFHSQEAEKAGEIMQGLIEKVGLYAVDNKSISADSIEEKFHIERNTAEEIIEKLVTMGALEKSEIENKYDVIMNKEALTKRINSYRNIVERIRAVSMSKNRNLEDITVSKILIKEENSRAVKTRVPGTWGEKVRYVWIKKENIMEIHNGKTMLTFLDMEKEYKLYDKNNKVVQMIKGSELYEGHYDSVGVAVRKRYEKMSPKQKITNKTEEIGKGKR